MKVKKGRLIFDKSVSRWQFEIQRYHVFQCTEILNRRLCNQYYKPQVNKMYHLRFKM